MITSQIYIHTYIHVYIHTYTYIHTYIGLVDGNVTNWEGCWELESHLPDMDTMYGGQRVINRRAHIMALHDSCMREKGVLFVYMCM